MEVGEEKPGRKVCFFFSFPAARKEIKIWFLSIFIMKITLLSPLILELKLDFQDQFESDNIGYTLRSQAGQKSQVSLTWQIESMLSGNHCSITLVAEF